MYTCKRTMRHCRHANTQRRRTAVARAPPLNPRRHARAARPCGSACRQKTRTRGRTAGPPRWVGPLRERRFAAAPPRFPAPPVRLGPAPGHRHGTSNPPLRASIDHMKSISNPQIYMYKCNSRGGRACRCWTLRSKPTSKPQTQSYHNGVETHASRILPKWMTRDSRLGRCAVFLDMFIDDVLV